MADIHDNGANRFVLDTLQLSVSLDSITTRDAPDKIAVVLNDGRQRYAYLLRQYETLPASADDAVLIQNMLDRLRASLKFLERLLSGKSA